MKRMRLLLVHDEPELTEQVTRELEDLGFEVDVAIDPGDAVGRVLSRVPDVVLVNLSLPRESGYELCEMLRGDESLTRMPIVVMSDRCSPEDIAYAEEAGANVFLKLPSPSKSLGTLARHLRALAVGTPPPSGPMVRSLRPPGGDVRTP